MAHWRDYQGEEVIVPPGTGIAATDVAVIEAAIVEGGQGGKLIFSPGSTYLIDAELNPNFDGAGTRTGQVWQGWGATLKRIDEVKSTVTSGGGTITATDTSVTVTDGSVFRIGMFVSAYQDATTYSTINSKITGIVGNVLTVAPAFNTTLTGATVISSCRMISSAVDDYVIEGFSIDGNRTNNASFEKYDVHCGLYLLGSGTLARYNHLDDMLGEGIVLGGPDSVCTTNWISQCGGNGIHLSAPRANNIRVTYNTVRFTNLGGANVGHVDGGIILSDHCEDSVIMGNYVEHALGYAFGSIDENRNRGLVLSGNIARNCDDCIEINPGTVAELSVTLNAGEMTSVGQILTISHTGIVSSIQPSGPGTIIAGMGITLAGAVQPEYNGTFRVATVPDDNTITVLFRGSSTSPATGTIVVTCDDDSPREITVTGNHFYDCGRVNINYSSTYHATRGPQRVNLTGNYFKNCYATILAAHNIQFKGNTWIYDADASIAVGSRTISVISIMNSSDVSVDDHIDGGLYGVLIQGTSCRNVSVSGKLRNNTKYGVFCNALLTTDYANIVISANISCDVDGASYIDTNRWAAVRTVGGVVVKDCDINAQYGKDTAYNGCAIYCSSGGSGLTTLITGNTIKGSATANGGGGVVQLIAQSGNDNILYDKNFISGNLAAVRDDDGTPTLVNSNNIAIV